MSADCGTRAQSFRGSGQAAEHFLFVEAPRELGFAEQVDALGRRYAEACAENGLAPETAVFRRVFLSDVLNQADFVRGTSLCADLRGSPVAVSIVQQPPLSGAKIALLAYHLDGPSPPAKQRLSGRHVVVRRDGLSHLWSTRLCAGACDAHAEAVQSQTREVFYDLIGALTVQGGSLRDHCIRTWLYLKDVDVFYQGMVDSRTEIFGQQGLTLDTHYIASTGIEGACAHQSDLVAMDAYSVLGLAPGQVSYLNDFEHMCRTHDYHVTFERGTRVGYADRAHFFISGTASIDHAGRVVHRGDVLRQADRAVENVEALMHDGGAELADLQYLIVYLRDPSDYPRIQARLRERFPHLPLAIVTGAVCRPEWLVEIEGIGIAAQERPDLPAF